MNARDNTIQRCKGTVMDKKLIGVLGIIIFLAGIFSHTAAEAYLYAANTDGTLTVVSADSGNVADEIWVASRNRLYAVAAHPDGARVYVTGGGGKVYVVDLAAKERTDEISISGSAPAAIVVSPDGTRVFVENGKGEVAVIDTEKKEVTREIDVGPYYVAGMAVDPSGTRLFVALDDYQHPRNCAVSAVDIAAATVTDTLSIPGTPTGIAVDPAGSMLYVAQHNPSGVWVVDAESFQAVDAFAAGSSPRDVVVTPDGTRLYVADRFESAVYVFDARALALIGTIAFGGRSTEEIAVNAVGDFLYVAGVGVRELDHFIYVVDTATNTGINAVRTRGQPADIAVGGPDFR